MEYATLAQGTQVQNLITRKKTSKERLQALLETGLFTDLLDVDASEINRNDLRAILGMDPVDRFSLFLKAGETTADLLKRGDYDSLQVSSENYPTIVAADERVVLEVVRFGMSLSIPQAIEKAKKQKLLPPTLQQSLVFGSAHVGRPPLGIVLPHEPVNGKVLLFGTNCRNFRVLGEMNSEDLCGTECPFAFVRPA